MEENAWRYELKFVRLQTRGGTAHLPVKLVEKEIDLLLHAEHLARLTLLDLVIADAPPTVDCASRLAFERVIVHH